MAPVEAPGPVYPPFDKLEPWRFCPGLTTPPVPSPSVCQPIEIACVPWESLPARLPTAMAPYSAVAPPVTDWTLSACASHPM